MHAVLDLLDPLLPADRPRYLMGVGTPEDLIACVTRGVDLFDSVLPTRIARHRAALTRWGRINLRNAQYADNPGPIEPGCGCYTCRTFSLAYLHHLVKADEILGLHLLTLHNLYLMLLLAREIRQAILSPSRDDIFTQYNSRREPS